jgi:hypothetical protein
MKNFSSIKKFITSDEEKYLFSFKKKFEENQKIKRYLFICSFCNENCGTECPKDWTTYDDHFYNEKMQGEERQEFLKSIPSLFGEESNKIEDTRTPWCTCEEEIVNEKDLILPELYYWCDEDKYVEKNNYTTKFFTFFDGLKFCKINKI